MTRAEELILSLEVTIAALTQENVTLRAERDEARADLNAWILDRGINGGGRA